MTSTARDQLGTMPISPLPVTRLSGTKCGMEYCRNDALARSAMGLFALDDILNASRQRIDGERLGDHLHAGFEEAPAIAAFSA